ncbi:hypothetical protein [Pseudomonas yamanorum]|uniref:hypothetical protein n=1 Tax=Pseudomonas yamanorum TaxID=515393 RepID=UPI003D36E4F9
MAQPLFDLDLKRVARKHYITSKAAINFPHPGSTTGGWHFLSYFDRESGVAKVSLAGIHYPDTTNYFGDLGITDVTDQLADRGWAVKGQRLFMADHYRAAADMVVRWALGESNHCSVEIDDWFPSRAERQRLLETLDTARSQLSKIGRWQKVEAWLRTQT